MKFAMSGVIDTQPIRRPTEQRRRHQSMLVTSMPEKSKWINEYSGFNLKEQQEAPILNVSKQGSVNTSQVSRFTESSQKPSLLKQLTLRSSNRNREVEAELEQEGTKNLDQMMNLLDNRQEILDSVDSFDFNVLNVSRAIGRENTFPAIVFRCMEDLPLQAS